MTFLLSVANALRETIQLATQGVPSHTTRRCFMMYWYMAQMIRCVALTPLLPVLSAFTHESL